MKLISALVSSVLLFMSPVVIFDFSQEADYDNWYIVDDGVMGGLSNGNFRLSEKGHGVFYGEISLENNGGFSSLRYSFRYLKVKPEDKIRIRLKGDGKPYEFRVKHDRRAYYSYVYTFDTSGEWQEILIPLKDMKAAFRGRDVNVPDFNKESIGELTFLFGNKKPETFRLMIDEISLLSN